MEPDSRSEPVLVVDKHVWEDLMTRNEAHYWVQPGVNIPIQNMQNFSRLDNAVHFLMRSVEPTVKAFFENE